MKTETKTLDLINSKINKLKADKVVSKKKIAKEMGIIPSQLSFYLKYGDIPKDRLTKLNSIIKRYEKRKAGK